jgi:creatinine amidohydrolase
MGAPRSVWLHELRWPEVEAHLASDDVILVPIGATEQHGRHLPLLVDTGWAVASAELAAKRAGALVAPAIPYGWSPHHMGYPGTVTLGAETLRRLAVDIGQSLVHHGFRRLILVNGNRIANLQPLEIAAVELINRTGAHVVVADTGLIARHAVKTLCEAADGGLDHAGEAETSLALFWAGDHVAMEEAPPVAPRNDAPAVSAFDYPVELDPALNGDAVSRFVTPEAHRAATGPAGSLGDPSAASAEKGRAMVEAIAANLVTLIEEVRRAPVGEVRAEIPV